ncbi:MAG: NUDIX hydrolase [Lachnospiraceae bacterium]|nr:NUDIX hydrolase [Lachnospiraceae bacterium]
MKITRLKRTEIAKGTIITYCHDTVKVPNGHICDYDFVKHQGAAAVLPVLDDGRILLVRQYRNALDRFTLEIPAGGLDGPDEPTINAAARELTEETGYVAKELSFLISVYPAVAYCNEKIDIYLARGLKKAERALDPDEFINVEAWDIKEIAKLIFEGRLQDAKTSAAVMSYYYMISKQS